MLDSQDDWKLTRQEKSDLMSLRGRLFKDLYQRAESKQRQRKLAKQAADSYHQAWDESRDSFPGINAATMSLLAGKLSTARQMTKQVVRRVKYECRQPGREHDFWLMATMGEAYLVLGKQREALDWYQQAVDRAGENMGDVASMSRQVSLIRRVSPVSDEILDVFDLGNIVVFAGHLIDHPDRLSNRRLKIRFPPDPGLEEAVRQAIRQKLIKMNARIGYCSVACGADILFAEELLKLKRTTLHVVLPFALKDFYKTSVDFGLEDDIYLQGWRERCDKVIRAAFEVHYATNDLFLGDEVLFDYGNSFSQGLSIIRAGRIAMKPVALCVLDPSSSTGVGTSSFYANWHGGDRGSETIDLANLRDEIKPKSRWPKKRQSSISADIDGFASREWKGRRSRRKCRALLFADVKNFSMIREELTPEFFSTFIDKVSSVVYDLPVKSVFRNTWGDGLFMVFKDALDCAELAQLRQQMVYRPGFLGVGGRKSSLHFVVNL